MKHPFTLALAVLIGIALGASAPRLFATRALAQAAVPMSMQSNAPTHVPSGTPRPMGGMTGPMMQMMPAPRSAADRAYMGAMMQMHGGMMRMTMTGNADHDFMVMMIPHHQAAVAMAQTELQYGQDARVRALATRIISAQRAEIREMQTWLK